MDLGVFKKSRRFAVAGVLTAALAATAFAACGGDDDTEDATATTPAGGATQAATTATGSTKTSYPLKVKDMLGRDVEIKAKPTTIVALSPTTVEYVYAVGGTVAGRSQTAEFPEAAKQAKDIGTSYQPNAEAILALKPDLVVADSVIQSQPQLRQLVEGLGVPVLFAGAESYKQVLDGLTLVGQVLDGQEKAKAAISEIEKAKDEAKAAVSANKASAVVLIAGRDNTLYSAKSTSYAGDLLTVVGLSNPAANAPDSGPGFPGYTTLAQEKLLEYNPDIIFTVTPGPASVPRLSTLLPNIPPFRGLKAITGKKVYELDVPLVLEAPGPRVSLALKQITAAVTGKAAAASPAASASASASAAASPSAAASASATTASR